MMVSEKVLKSVHLAPEDFYADRHQLIYEAVQEATVADPIVVADVLRRRGLLERVGGKHYLFALVSTVANASYARHHEAIVAECALLRRLIDAATVVAQKAYERPENASTLAQEAKQSFSRFVEEGEL